MKTNGMYYIHATDGPDGRGNGYLEVISASDAFVSQLFIPFNIQGTAYMRLCNNGVWTSWCRIITEKSEVISGDATVDTSVVASGSCKYYKYGRVCFVYWDIVPKTALSGTRVYPFSGLPTSINECECVISGVSDLSSKRIIENGTCAFIKSGKVQGYFPTTEHVYSSCCYIATD